MRCPGICCTPLSIPVYIDPQPTNTHIVSIMVSSHTAILNLRIVLFNCVRDNYLYNPGANPLNSLITLYCVRYNPFYCKSDPERIWRVIEPSGGSVHALVGGIMDFYVPAHIITQVIMMDSGLRLRTADSYI